MTKAIKLGHVALRSADVGRLAAYYTNVLDFVAVGGSNGTAYLSVGSDPHVVAIEHGPPGLAHLAFQIEGSLVEAAKRLQSEGIESALKSDAEPGIPALLEIEDPEGNVLQLYGEADLREVQEPRDLTPQKLGHVCYFVTDVQQTLEFYERMLGFRWSDWIGDFFVFLRCNADHHTVNLLRSERNRRLHHIAYELRDWAHIQLACDRLAQSGFRLVWGPGRHGPGHNVFTYHRDPDGSLVELFCELDVMIDESRGSFEPRPWHEEVPQRPKVWMQRVPNTWGPGPPEDFLQ
jgi:catechol 2,3-dioxygenase-like lactoylglutathione lyase family enzyme